MRRALILLSLVLAAPAHAQWSPPVTVAGEAPGREFGTVIRDYHLAMDGSGGGVVVWQQFSAGERFLHPVIMAADVAADGSVGTPEAISPRDAYGPRLAVAGDGQAAVIYATGPPGLSAVSHKTGRVQLVRRAPGGHWSKPTEIGAGRTNISSDVVIEPSGTVAAAWLHYDRGETRATVGRFRGSHRVTGFQLRRGTTRPRLAASPAFPRATVGYLVNRHHNAGPKTLHLRVGSGDVVLDRNQDRDEYSIAADTSLAIVWGTYSLHGARPGLRIARMSPGDDAPRIDQLDRFKNGFQDSSVDTRDDITVVAWRRPHNIRFARAASGDAFSEPVDLDPAAEEGSVATRIAGGRTIAVWLTDTRSSNEERVFGVVSDPGAPFGTPTELTTPDEAVTIGAPEMAMSADGSALVAYLSVPVGSGFGGPSTLRVARLPV